MEVEINEKIEWKHGYNQILFNLVVLKDNE